MRRTSAVVATVIASLTTLLASEAVSPTPNDLVGVWRICNTPVPNGVLCLLHGYLVLLPDGRFITISDRSPSLGPKRVIMNGTYRTEGATVILRGIASRTVEDEATGNQPQGEERFRWTRSELIEFGGDTPGSTRVPVLKPEEGKYCGYGRIF